MRRPTVWPSTGVTAASPTGPWTHPPTSSVCNSRGEVMRPVPFTRAFPGRLWTGNSGGFRLWCTGRSRQAWGRSPGLVYLPRQTTAPGFSSVESSPRRVWSQRRNRVMNPVPPIVWAALMPVLLRPLREPGKWITTCAYDRPGPNTKTARIVHRIGQVVRLFRALRRRKCRCSMFDTGLPTRISSQGSSLVV